MFSNMKKHFCSNPPMLFGVEIIHTGVFILCDVIFSQLIFLLADMNVGYWKKTWKAEWTTKNTKKILKTFLFFVNFFILNSSFTLKIYTFWYINALCNKFALFRVRKKIIAWRTKLKVMLEIELVYWKLEIKTTGA